MKGTWKDDTGSLPLAMLLILLSVTLGTLMTPMLLTQLNSTRVEARRVHSLQAAQTGLDIAMGHIRAANDGAGNGVLSGLPCGPYEGGVVPAAGGNGSGGRYRVEIVYYSLDPRGKSETWLKTQSNQVQCFVGAGTDRTPNYALLTAVGTDDPGGDIRSSTRRTLTATYTFQTTNQNIAGGLIHVYKTTTSTDLCLDAGSNSPTPGTDLKIQPCDANNLAQIWIYNKNLTITLSSSRAPSMPLGMCVDVAPPQSPNTRAKLQPCGTSTLPQQQWSINDSANLQGTKTGVNLDGPCLVVQSPNTAGSLIVAGNTGCGGPYNNVHTFSAEASVGAGAAGGSSNQVVNFAQFGRCVDVTDKDVNKGYLIVWPCKQAPDASKVSWNQKWMLPAVDPTTNIGTGRITTSNGALYCLRSPSSTASGQYVTVVKCPAAATPQTTWTYYAQTASYATSYVVRDHNGNCLAPTDPSVDRFTGGGQNVSKVRVAQCDGSTSQKWNAPPNILRPFPLKDLAER